MKRTEWTICERAGRWAAALRLAIQRANWPPQAIPRLFEIRRLADLDARLESRPNGLVLVEVQLANFADVLARLATAGQLYPCVYSVALLDTEVAVRTERRLIVDALREAGASDIVSTPRHSSQVLSLAKRIVGVPRDSTSSFGELSLIPWVWESLPWQAE